MEPGAENERSGGFYHAEYDGWYKWDELSSIYETVGLESGRIRSLFGGCTEGMEAEGHPCVLALVSLEPLGLLFLS